MNSLTTYANGTVAELFIYQNGIKMRKFGTKEELVEWIETMHLQNTNGRETEEEMFRLGIEAAIEELTEFNLFSIPVVVGQSEQLPPFYCPNCGNEWDTNKNNACQCGAYVRR